MVRGAAEHHNVPGSLIWFGGSLSKAFGCRGDISRANEAEMAKFRATPVGSSAGPGMPAAAATCAASLRFVHRGLT